MEQAEESYKSKFSSGLNIIFRLDALWRDTHLHSRANLYTNWNNDLDCIWRELARDLNEDKYNEWCKKIDDIDDELKALGKVNDYEPEGFTKVEKKEIDKREEQYKFLNKKQLILARLENELGKGTTLQQDEEDWE